MESTAVRRSSCRRPPSATREDQQAVGEPSLQPTRHVDHSIFLSHSKEQKGFVERLNDQLCLAGHFPFFDVHSIPKGVAFPPCIKQAAIQTKLGVVILSDDFMLSKWPMMELELFTNSDAQVVPLYYKLSPDDLTKWGTWVEKWQRIANEDRTIDVSKWEKAVRDLASQNGEIYYSGMSEGAYIKKVVRKICERLPPPVIYDVSYVKGHKRFIQELETKFQLESVIGVHGVGGQGKTTVCRVMANFYKSAHYFESAVMEFPSVEDKHSILVQFKKVLERLNLANKERVDKIDCIDEAMQVMKDRMKSRQVFLALDNVWEHCGEEAKRILEVDFCPGSKVLVTSRSEECLKGLLNVSHYAPVRPLISVNEHEALEILCDSFEGDLLFASRTSLERALRLCRFSGSYHPMALKALGRYLKIIRRVGDSEPIEKKLARISSDVKGYETIDKLIKMNYDSTSRVGKSMFLDVAVVFRRTRTFKNYKQWRLRDYYGPRDFKETRFENFYDEDVDFEEMREWLRSLYEHECDHDKIDYQIECLALDGLVQFVGDGKQRKVTVHDLFLRLAESEAAASSRILLAERGNMEAVQWAELERVVLDGRCDKRVDLQVCPKLQLLYASGQRFPEGLQLEGARALRLLKVIGCRGLLRILDVVGCASLRVLLLEGCEALEEIAGMALPSNLEKLGIRNCGSLRRIPDVGGCASLRELNLEECGALKEIAGMALPSNLEVLRIEICRSLRRIPDVGGCASLLLLFLAECGALEEIAGMALPSNLKELVIRKCGRLRRIPDVGGCASLQELDVGECGALEVIAGMALPSNLEQLCICDCGRLRRIPDVGGCASLGVFNVEKCGALEEIAGIAFPSNNLVWLRIVDCWSLRRIPDEGGCEVLVMREFGGLGSSPGNVSER